MASNGRTFSTTAQGEVIAELASDTTLLLERLAQTLSPVWREVRLENPSTHVVPGQAA